MATPDAALPDALKRATSALKHGGPPFALAGSYALWVFGAPRPEHDADLVVAEADTEAAAAALADAGFDIERTPEDWLFKARSDEAMVDVLHRVNGNVVTPDLIETAEVYEVLALRMPVLDPTTVITMKLRSMNEHYCDFAGLLPGVRAVREQLDWQRIRADTATNDFAAAFLFLADRLGLTG